jgi:hypothetical protein
VTVVQRGKAATKNETFLTIDFGHGQFDGAFNALVGKE